MNDYFRSEGHHVLFADLEWHSSTDFKPLKGINSNGFSIIHLFRKYSLSYLYGYLKDKKGIWWLDGYKRSVMFVTHDVTSFEVIDDDYAKDTDHVYFQYQPLPNAHPATFTLMTGTPYFAKDRNQAYCRSDRTVEILNDVDSETFVVCSHQTCTDKDHVYHYYGRVAYDDISKSTETVYSERLQADQPLKDYLLETYPYIKGWWHPEYDKKENEAVHLALTYYKSSTGVFYEDSYIGRVFKSVIRHADPATFTPLDEYYSRDKHRVFYKWHNVKGADCQSFRALGKKFAKDDQNIYYNGYKVEGADYDSFQLQDSLHNPALDKNIVYTESFRKVERFGLDDDVLVPVKNSSPKSFTPVSPKGDWAIDDESVYWYGTINKNMDRTTFQFLFYDDPNSWAKDKNSLYNSNGRRTVKGIDGASFQVLNKYWGKDKDSVFYFKTERILKSVDAATFQVLDELGGAEDQNYIYMVDEFSEVKKSKKA